MKERLAIVFGILIIMVAFAIDNYMANKGIEQCIAGGQDVRVCEELRK